MSSLVMQEVSGSTLTLKSKSFVDLVPTLSTSTGSKGLDLSWQLSIMNEDARPEEER